MTKKQPAIIVTLGNPPTLLCRVVILDIVSHARSAPLIALDVLRVAAQLPQLRRYMYDTPNCNFVYQAYVVLKYAFGSETRPPGVLGFLNLPFRVVLGLVRNPRL